MLNFLFNGGGEGGREGGKCSVKNNWKGVRAFFINLKFVCSTCLILSATGNFSFFNIDREF